MTAELPFVDPGYGNRKAGPGTVGFAQGVRLNMQGLVKHLESTPQSFADYIEMCVEGQIWTLLNYPEGGPEKPKSKEKFFASFKEYCAYPEPWGLATPWEKIRPHVENLLSSEARRVLVDAAELPPSKSDAAEEKPRGEAGRFATADNISCGDSHKTYGTDPQYLLGRLKRDAANDKKPERQARAQKALDDYISGALPSAYAAAKAAGVIKPTAPTTRAARAISDAEDLAVLADGLLKKVPQDRLVELMAMIVDRLPVDGQRRLLQWVQLALEGS